MVSESRLQLRTLPWIVMFPPWHDDSGPLALSSTHGLLLQRTETTSSSFALPHELEAVAWTVHVTFAPAVHSPILTSRLKSADAPAASWPEKTCTPPTVTV